MINRYSSLQDNIGETLLKSKLKNAQCYDRIAGYFSSSIIEVAGETIDSVKGNIRIICNSQLHIDDVRSLSAAHQGMRIEWCGIKPEEKFSEIPERLQKLHQLLKSGKMQVKVIPNECFGLIHGKAGVITLENGSKTAFLGSMNETSSGWNYNYELAWEDDSEEAIEFVQKEFDYLWKHPSAKPLSNFIIEDIKRISVRKVIYDIELWKKEENPASPIIETPIFRKEYGLWEHQKYFIDLVYRSFKFGSGARYILADMVGLGKTVQLALSAQLMALDSEKPILIIAPKTLLWQWQDELHNLLDMPSAVWNGKLWIDENGIEHPGKDENGFKKCPRRIGIISQGLITSRSEVIEKIKSIEFECIIVDESHRARRRNLAPGRENRRPEPNNLMEFLLLVSKNTKNMLLATATPVQINPIEAWDLLYILAQGNDYVLGNEFSKWRTDPKAALDYAMGRANCENESEYWDWIRNPLPNKEEEPKTFGTFRRLLKIPDEVHVVEGSRFDSMKSQEKVYLQKMISDNFIQSHNPFIRHIVRRTREFLENEINPETGESYLKKIKLLLFGESEAESISLTPYLQDAYETAEQFSILLKERIKSSGFIKTLLLRRVGSTMIAGRNTAQGMLNNNLNINEDDDYDEDNNVTINSSHFRDFTRAEVACLQKFVSILDEHIEEDPKYKQLISLLIKEKWLDRGCIVFSQYYDSIRWVAEKITIDIPGEVIGLYAGGDKSGVFIDGIYQRKTKEDLKKMVKNRQLRLLLGTDAASEGLNLQTLSTLINLDLPWNPTRLEQRKGRIQRIGQVSEDVWIYNMRYRNSVEDRVHGILSTRLQNIHSLFGQIPDVLEDVWVQVALNEIDLAEQIIDNIPKSHPFEIRYEKNVGNIDWESCSTVLDRTERRSILSKGW